MLKKKTVFRVGILFAVVLLSADLLFAQTQAVAVSDKQKINIGDELKLEVAISLPKDFTLEQETVPQDKIAEFKVIEFEQKEEAKEKNKIKIVRLSYVLTIYRAGEFKIPELEFLVKSAAGEARTLKTKAIEVKVESLLGQEQNPDIKPRKPKFNLWLARLLWGIVILVLILAGIYFLRKFRRSKKNQAAILAPAPAHVIALAEMNKLEEEKLIEQARFEEFFTRLSLCLRHYLENRFLLRAPQMSTEEFLETAKKSAVLDAGQKELLAGFLALSDLVKFARYGCSKKEAADSLVAGRRFVEQTKIEETPEEIKKT